MKCAVIGAGFSGMAICYHLSTCFPKAEIVLYDSNPIGESTSGKSSGLMHYFPGEKAKRSWQGELCYQESKRLLAIAEKTHGQKLFEETGCFKPVQNKAMERQLRKRAKEFPDEVKWWDLEQSKKYGLVYPGLFIEKAITVSPKRYLSALYTYLTSFSFSFVQQKVTSLQELKFFDQIFVAAGPGNLQFDPIDRDYEMIKGHLIYCDKKEIKLPFPIVGKGHILARDNKMVIGATYERDFSSLSAQKEKALPLKEKVASFFPPVANLEISFIDCGVRMAQKGIYLPMLSRLDAKTIILGAFGSRGLLYHAYFAKLAVSCFARFVYKNS